MGFEVMQNTLNFLDDFKKGYRLKAGFWPNLDAPKKFWQWALNFSSNWPKYKMAPGGLLGWVKNFFAKTFFQH